MNILHVYCTKNYAAMCTELYNKHTHVSHSTMLSDSQIIYITPCLNKCSTFVLYYHHLHNTPNESWKISDVNDKILASLNNIFSSQDLRFQVHRKLQLKRSWDEKMHSKSLIHKRRLSIVLTIHYLVFYKPVKRSLKIFIHKRSTRLPN